MPQQQNQPSNKTQTTAKTPTSYLGFDAFVKSFEQAREYSTSGLGIRASLGTKQEIVVEGLRGGSNAWGLRVGDLIVGVNGKTMNASEIVKQINSDKDGNFRLKVKRGSSVIALDVTGYHPHASLGLRSESVSVPNMTLDNGMKIRIGHAPSVTAVSPESPAAKLKLQEGDIILAIKRSGEKNFTVFGGEAGNDKFAQYRDSLKAGQKVTIVYGHHDGHYGIKSHTATVLLPRRTSVPIRESFSL